MLQEKLKINITNLLTSFVLMLMCLSYFIFVRVVSLENMSVLMQNIEASQSYKDWIYSLLVAPTFVREFLFPNNFLERINNLEIDSQAMQIEEFL